jgi:hypothetical protein
MPEGIVYPGEDQQEVNDDVVISWQFDWYPTVVLNDASLRGVDGEPVEMNTSSPELDDYFNVVALTASGPLSPGTTYTAAITVTLSERQLSRAWSFVTQPTGVAISGPEEGTTDKEYTYTAITTHSSALRPITYTWQASGQGPVTHVAGPSDYVSFAWSTPATQTITVTAKYGENLVSDIHSTVIRHAVWLPLVMRDL